ncbi:MAG TPA: nucleotide disphospho-sugar-binding domain-containing protein [Kribbella sp.]|nr:nucleotide disphospho-sugar-binding domain-containing protein [Kribbella sp.]
MATFLVYVEPVPGRVYPLVSTLQELGRLGHRVTVRSGAAEVDLLRSVGIEADLLAPELVRFDAQDWRARTRFGALMRALNQFGERAGAQAEDLRRTITAEQPDVVIIDETSWGAAAAAEHSGLPWAFSVPSPIPIPSRDAPPFGLGLTPRHDRVGRLRDRLAAPLTVGTLGRIIAKHVNPVRTELGLTPLRTLEQFYLAASLILAYTAEPFEYPRTDWPPEVLLVGPGLWEPPADPPPWLNQFSRTPVLATCSLSFQNDSRLAEAVCAAFAGEPVDVVITTGDVDVSGLQIPPNVRLERFVPHSPVLDRAACVICHAGMGITQKALAHGVPVVAVPFGRDQPEVARRVEVAGAGVRLPARALTPDRLRSAVYQAIQLQPGAQRIAAAFAAAGGSAAAAATLVGLAAT